MKAIAILSILLTSACTSGGIIGKRDPGQALVNECMFETGIKGAYSSPAGQKVPVLTPITTQGGTQRGATVLNACIESKAAAGGQSTAEGTSGATTSKTTTYGTSSAKAASRLTRRTDGFCPKYAGVIYGGVTYCIDN
ncbi:hypothetical protein [Roseovarius litorisediminis]|nr:hypothetical protein [Roseovarius litorisediminis]